VRNQLLRKTKQEEAAVRVADEEAAVRVGEEESLRVPEEGESSRTAEEVSERVRDGDAQKVGKGKQNPEYTERERRRIREAKRKARQDPEYADKERKRNAEATRKVRQDPEYAERERKRNEEAKKESRTHAIFRAPEKKRDAEAHSFARQNETIRSAERTREAQLRRTKQDNLTSNYSKLFQKFRNKIKEAPSFICSCCGGLFYKDATTIVSSEVLKEKGCSDELIQNILHVNQVQHRICSTCKTYAYKKMLPRLSLVNGFDFPRVPDVLKVTESQYLT